MSLPSLDASASVVRLPEPIEAEAADGLVLLSLDAGAFISLNDTAAAIWRHLAQPVRIDRLCALIAEEYATTPQACAPEVIACVTKLIDSDLAVATS
ncbi:MAG TPA: PqqD family protein [Caulobacteraceae bacterium]|jgi:hypothetical protein|nr:PqqD family protein [Caulobacteraceae bacterium]